MIRAPVFAPLNAIVRGAGRPAGGEVLRYANGDIAQGLIADADYYGAHSTAAAIDALSATIHNAHQQGTTHE